MEMIIVFAVMAAFVWLGSYILQWYERSQQVDFDINEGIEPAIEQLPPARALRARPELLDELRPKISKVGFNPAADRPEGLSNVDFDIAESYVIDKNGAIHTLAKTFEGEGAPTLSSTNRRRGPADALADMRAVERRNADIEQDARWLADQLGVPFEEG